jgi:hypothetical protein
MNLRKRLVKAYLHADPDVEGLFNALLGLLRAMAWNYQTAHWQAGGDAAYGNHLLFQRLYEGLGPQIDELAEKMVGYQGIHAVHPVRSIDFTAQWLARWDTIACPFQRGLQSEVDFQDSVRKTYDVLKEIGVMTLGLDDWLMATANAHETNTYLLQQVLDKQHAHDSKAASGAPSEEGRFFDNPEKREVRELAQTDAISNDPEVAAEAARTDVIDEPVREVVQEAREAPPTPEEIVEEPGGAAVSTLNRYLVETEEQVPAAVPQSHEEVPKHPVITAGWDDWTLL